MAECLADNKVMIRLDLRDNPCIGSAGLLALHLAMKMNTSLTVLNLDTSVAQSSSLKVLHLLIWIVYFQSCLDPLFDACKFFFFF